MTGVDIVSPANPRIKRLVDLRDRRSRDEASVFVVEGERHMSRALAAGMVPAELYFDPGLFPEPPYPASRVFSVKTGALDRASYRGRSQGVIGVFEQFEVTVERLRLGTDPLVMVVEGIEKPGNLGALLRTADAVGATALIAADPGTDAFNPNVIRASTGALFTVPLAVTSLGTAVAWLRSHEVRIVAAHPDAETVLWESDLTGPIALLVGSEHRGLGADALGVADLTVSIPMRGHADSLNTSISAAVLVYESLRQRSLET
jgi:TrmH family RNA methyltransferase